MSSRHDHDGAGRVLRAPDDPLLGGAGGGGQEPPASPSMMPARAASVTFRQQSGDAGAVQMLDPANQSLAEALNILLKLLYVGVGLLFLAYLASGFKLVQEGERGIRLLFGKVQDANLEPGFRWGPPFPFGDIQTVPQGVETLNVDRDFWVFLQSETGQTNLDSISPTASLVPDQGGSGSLILGDGNLVHARWQAQYRRSGARNFAENVLQGTEMDLVRAAVKRAVVQVCADEPIETLLQSGAERQGALAARARDLAQASLDRMNVGIQIEALRLTEVTPPLWVRRDFAAAQTATSNAQKGLENALAEASGTLNGAAGEVATHLTSTIDAYEAALAVGDDAAARAAIAEIDRVLEGAEVRLADGTTRRVSGRVTNIVNEAKAYRTRVVQQAQSDLERFQAMLSQFKGNPLVMVQREWASAVGSFYRRPAVNMIMMPPMGRGDLMQVLVNRDPFAQKEIQRQMRERQIRDADAQRRQEIEARTFRTTAPNPADAQ